MELNEVISDAFKYPLSDYKKFFILGIPNLILSIVIVVLGLQIDGLDSFTSTDSLLSSPLFTTFLATFLVFLLVAIISQIFMCGIGISVIRNTHKFSHELPDLEPGKNLLDGIKYIVVSIVYGIVIGIISLIIFFILSAILGDSSASFLLSIIILFVILVITSILLIISFNKLAETNSISEALNISNVYNIAKDIGLLKIFGTFFICNIITGILISIGEVIDLIPIIGSIIFYYVILTYTQLVEFRVYGLIYNNHNQNSNTYQKPSMDFTPNNTIEDYTENQVNDFQPATNVVENDVAGEVNTEIPETNATGITKCRKCGYSNPDFVNICVNCGNDLK